MVTTAARKYAKQLDLLDVFREELRLEAPLPVSDWAARHRVLPSWSPKPGRWKNENSPYLVEMMDAFSDPLVDTIVVVSGAQIGKSEFILNCLGAMVCQDPGTCLVTLPSEKEADKFAKRRIHPMVVSSPEVLRRVDGGTDALGLKEMKFDRCVVSTAWSNSPGAMSQTPCRYVIGDEIDKYPPYAGREGSPIRLMEARTLHFEGRCKKVFTSTPTTENGYVWPLFLSSTQYQYYIPCAKCGRFQVLDFHRGVKWPKSAPLEIYEKRLAWYECSNQKCKQRMDDAGKIRAVALGRWVAQGQRIGTDGKITGKKPPRHRVGYQISGLYSPMMSFSKAAAIFLESVGDLGLMHDFRNTILGLPFQDKVEVITERKIKRACASYKLGTVPKEARILTAGIDVQEDHFWIAVRAWGEHERSWLVRAGQLLSFKQVEDALAAGYPSEDGARRHSVDVALVDSGYRTNEVYEFTRRLRAKMVFASKGSGHPGLIKTVPRPSYPEPGVTLYSFQANHWKDVLAGLIAAEHGGPREWRIPSRPPEEYIKHMIAERRVLRRRGGRKFTNWEPLTESTPNHLWDCEVLNVLAAHLAQVRFLHLAAAPAPASPKLPPGHPSGDWIDASEGWLDGNEKWLDG